MLKFKLAKFMHLFGNSTSKQPHVFDNYFYYVKDILSCNCRIAERNDFYLYTFIQNETHPIINLILTCKNLE